MSIVKRTTAGHQTGVLLGTLGTWNIRQTGDDRYKVASIEPVNGKANYAFAVAKSGLLDGHIGLDAGLLRKERPALAKAVEAFFVQRVVLANEPEPSMSSAPENLDEADPYGDLAISRKQRTTPAQEWKRGLLYMRRVEFEHAAVKRKGIWEAGVRMLWAGVFKTKISDEDAAAAIEWITKHPATIDLQELLVIEREYYSHKHRPHNSEWLSSQLDGLSINDGIEFDNLEETNGPGPNEGERDEPSTDSGSRVYTTTTTSKPIEVARPESDEERYAAFL